MALPPTFRTYHSNQQPMSPFHLMYPAHLPFSVNHPWSNVGNEPISALTNNNAAPAEQAKGSKNRARSVDTGPSAANPGVRPLQAQAQAQPAPVPEHYFRYRIQPQAVLSTAPVAEVKKEASVPAVG